jgi:guanyl-specific ribonuclease Sa
MKKILSMLLILALAFSLFACTVVPAEPTEPSVTQAPTAQIDKNGSYTTKEDVALYLHIYGELPQNFMTKAEAKKLGWRSGALEPYAPGCCIGGDNFQNREGLLPRKDGRQYYECDINTMGGGPRGAERIVFSNDGLIYYTSNHYGSFELLYGTP